MRITSKGRYGLKAAMLLAEKFNGNKLIKSREIAGSEDIPLKYLEQIINTLKKNNIVASSRGAVGGHRLARSPEKITVYEIILALEGDLSVMDHSESSHLSDGAGVFWQELDSKIKDMLEIPLSEFLLSCNRDEQAYMFYI